MDFLYFLLMLLLYFTGFGFVGHLFYHEDPEILTGIYFLVVVLFVHLCTSISDSFAWPLVLVCILLLWSLNAPFRLQKEINRLLELLEEKEVFKNTSLAAHKLINEHEKLKEELRRKTEDCNSWIRKYNIAQSEYSKMVPEHVYYLECAKANDYERRYNKVLQGRDLEVAREQIETAQETIAKKEKAYWRLDQRFREALASNKTAYLRLEERLHKLEEENTELKERAARPSLPDLPTTKKLRAFGIFVDLIHKLSNQDGDALDVSVAVVYELLIAGVDFEELELNLGKFHKYYTWKRGEWVAGVPGRLVGGFRGSKTPMLEDPIARDNLTYITNDGGHFQVPIEPMRTPPRLLQPGQTGLIRNPSPQNGIGNTVLVTTNAPGNSSIGLAPPSQNTTQVTQNPGKGKGSTRPIPAGSQPNPQNGVQKSGGKKRKPDHLGSQGNQANASTLSSSRPAPQTTQLTGPAQGNAGTLSSSSTAPQPTKPTGPAPVEPTQANELPDEMEIDSFPTEGAATASQSTLNPGASESAPTLSTGTTSPVSSGAANNAGGFSDTSNISPFGRLGTPGTASSVSPFGRLGTPGTASSVSSFGRLATPGTTSSVSSFGRLSTPGTSLSVASGGFSDTSNISPFGRLGTQGKPAPSGPSLFGSMSGMTLGGNKGAGDKPAGKSLIDRITKDETPSSSPATNAGTSANTAAPRRKDIFGIPY